LQFAYEQTGDTKYLVRQQKLLLRDIAFVTNRTPTDISSQAFIATDLTRPVMGWKALSGVTVENLGGGSYRLSWTVPTGATGYKIKYATKNIVNWLGFNQNTRSYALPPGSNTPWFAASNISNEPAPAAEGTLQTVTLNGLDATKTFNFGVRFTTTFSDTVPPSPPKGLKVN
jgi:hypothetical protein